MTEAQCTVEETVAWLKTCTKPGAEITLDSRAVKPGDVFVALKGAKTDGLAWAEKAAAAGAAAVLYEPRETTPVLAVPSLAVPELRRRLGLIASALYGEPSFGMVGIGITGTNGKTSISHWVSALLTRLGQPCAAIGTIGTFFKGSRFPAPALTTPDAASTQTLFKSLKTAGAEAFAIEASSIGLDQGRLSGTAFKTAVFTNLTRDHLDYHGTFEAYEAAKARLFDWPGLACAVINADDACGRRFIERTVKRGVRTIAYTVSDETAAGAQMLAARTIRPTASGTAFTVLWQGKEYDVAVRAIGRFNVLNLLAVAGTALSLGCEAAEVFAALGELDPPAGRLQRVASDEGPLCVVDYAHTPDALEKVLTALRETAEHRGGKLRVVFGAGGDRDHGKRPLMGETASRLADAVTVTSDNPRSEDPQSIIDMITAGCKAARTLVTEPDRRRAIEATVAEASPCDVVLVAGKGHEDYQEILGVKHHFSDVEVVRAALAARSEKVRIG